MTSIARHTRLMLAVGWLVGSTGTLSSAHAESSSTHNLDALDLPTAIELALQNNPDLKATQSDEDVASAQTDKVSAGRWPTLKAQARFTEYRRNQRLYPAAVPGEPAVVTHHMFGGDVLLSIPIYTGGRVSGSIDSAKQTEESARLASRWTKVDVVFCVTALYYSILAQRQLIAALSSSEAAMIQNIEKLNALVEERKAAPLDRQRMEVRLAALKQHRVQEETAVKVQTLNLVSTIGLTSRASTTRVVGELQTPSIGLRSGSERLFEEAASRRADCRALRVGCAFLPSFWVPCRSH